MIVRFVLALLITAAVPAWAQEAIGFVKTVSGDATVVNAGKPMKAEVGMPVRLGNVLSTGAKGSMGVTFKDNTVLSLGPDSEVAIDEYVYAPGSGNLKFGASMSKGTLNTVSGVIAKLKPGASEIKTPSGTIGIRGTQFLVKVEP